MSRIRVLLVDDSVTVRRLVGGMLDTDPEIDVVGTAANGRIALEKVIHLNPDVVILDIEMPELDGLETLAAVRRTHPRLPVIMFSQHTRRGAVATLDALALGANDYVAKPEQESGVDLDAVRDQLLMKIKGLCRGRLVGARPSAPAVPVPQSWGSASRVEAIVVAVSTGGPKALSVLLGGLPASLPVPIIVVQHMPPLFSRLLVERLAAVSQVEVVAAVAGETPRPGSVHVCPGNEHLELVRVEGQVKMALTQGPPENSCRPSADVLFRTAADIYGAGLLGVVMTGMGQDGLRGCERIRERSGRVVVQDEASSVVWGMPGAVHRAGLADAVVPLDQLASELMMRVRRGRTASASR